MLGGGVDAATLVAALGAGPPPPDCRLGRRPHRGATACRLLERDDRGVDGPGVEGDSRLGEHTVGPRVAYCLSTLKAGCEGTTRGGPYTLRERWWLIRPPNCTSTVPKINPFS